MYRPYRISNGLYLFAHKKFGRVRAIMHNDEPYFSACDVADILGYGNHIVSGIPYAIKDHCTNYCEIDHFEPTLGPPPVTFDGIPIFDVYSLVKKSPLPGLIPFEFMEWIIRGVVPAIRHLSPWITQENDVPF